MAVDRPHSAGIQAANAAQRGFTKFSMNGAQTIGQMHRASAVVARRNFCIGVRRGGELDVQTRVELASQFRRTFDAHQMIVVVQ